jgi:peptide-methionine (R)-S-oxide reductase
VSSFLEAVKPVTLKAVLAGLDAAIEQMDAEARPVIEWRKTNMTRRGLLQGLLAGGIWSILKGILSAAQTSSMKEVEALQNNWKALLAEGVTVPRPTERLKLTKEEWRKRLEPEQFQILREEGTERPGTSPLNNEKRAGIFTCVACGLPLFTSEMKYESGTGWPSFFTTIPGAFETSTDFKLFLPRTEYHCARCGGHHGHVFDDGPPPTGKPWCNNGVALKFIPKNRKT